MELVVSSRFIYIAAINQTSSRVCPRGGHLGKLVNTVR